MSVYFARRTDDTGPIKIGCSAYPVSRIKQLSSDMKVSLSILATAPGMFRDEGRMHRHLAADRQEGEWFAPSAAVLAALHHVIDTGELPPVDEGDREAVMPA